MRDAILWNGADLRGKIEMNPGMLPLAELLGADEVVPVYGGRTTRYVNLDYAATTPPLKRVWDRLAEVMPLYGSVHRGSGFKSVISTRLFENSLDHILTFSDAHPEQDVLVLSWNTTSGINILARRLGLTKDSVVITSEHEHTSNLLPWRKHASAVECHTEIDGTLDLNHLEQLLKSRPVRLVAVTAASNVTGAILDVHSVAAIAHSYGSRILVDASQFMAHRKLYRKSHDSPEHLDFVVYSGHKMYAPFGVGVLVGPLNTFSKGWPDQVGGGTINLIDGDEIVWADLPGREQGGTPNLPGVVALAEACSVLEEIGFERIADHERALIRHVGARLLGLPRVAFYREFDSLGRESVAVFPFGVDGYHHFLVSAFLGYERGIGVRAGHLCQYALIRRLLSTSEEDRFHIRQEVASGDRRRMYGLVRASCGIATTLDELDILSNALHDLVDQGPAASYEQGLNGEYHIPGWTPTHQSLLLQTARS